MYRLFQTHKVRQTEELSSSLWDFRIAENGLERTEKVFVPGCWETIPGLGNYRGEAIYFRKFTAGGNIRLEFKGVSHTAQIFVDGTYVKEHYGAYTPFDIVLQNLKQGEHILEVRVDNRFGEKSALHIPNDYMTYGGINRPVVLEQLGHAYLKWTHYTTKKIENCWQLQVNLCIHCLEAAQELSARVQIAGRTFCLREKNVCGTDIYLSGSFPMEDVQEWSVENPYLYSVEACLFDRDEVIDDLIDRIGFREVKLQGNRIMLNGRAVRIKGVCRHEDFGGFGCAVTAAAMQKDLQMIKDLGCNSVRTSHYPNDEIFLDLCDEQGILVWEENHARGLVEENMRNPNFDWQCELCIEEMIQNHFNHPSIYIWGILNECATETEYGRKCYQKQLNQIRMLDPDRPHTFATCRFEIGEGGKKVSVTDICLDLPDVVSCNIYPQWYFDGDVTQFLKLLQSRIDETPGAGKPMLISEIGAGGEYGFHSAEHLKWSEEYQADALEEQISAVLANDSCCGIYIWQYCDIRVSREWFAGRPRCHNNKGIVDEYRRPKYAYAVVKRILRNYDNYLAE